MTTIFQKAPYNSIETNNLVEIINSIFNMNLTIKNITDTINAIDQAIKFIDDNMKKIINNKDSKVHFLNDLVNFLDTNYEIGNFLNENNMSNYKFTNSMQCDTLANVNDFLQNNVNIVAMTATSNQTYAIFYQ